MSIDKNGNKVKVGARVRVIEINPSVTAKLSEEEARDINSMINEVFEVYEIDKYDCAWVEKWWNRGNGKTESHSLSLSSQEMELVK